jgi:hypothetical protein
MGRVGANGWESDEPYCIAGARTPNVILGTTSSTTNKVILLYSGSSPSATYLRRRFLGCDGTIGAYSNVMVLASDIEIWQIEAAYNQYLDQWRIWWGQFDSDTPTGTSNDLWSTTVDWDGVVGDHSLFVWCDTGTKSGTDADAGDSVNESGTEALLSTGDGCKHFNVSFDPSQANGNRRFLMSRYGQYIGLLNGTSGAQVATLTGHFPYPLTGVCNATDYCSYQEIGRTHESGVYHRLTSRRFDDDVHFHDCDGAEDTITPLVSLLYPHAMATSDSEAVVLYSVPDGTSEGYRDVFMTVLDN